MNRFSVFKKFRLGQIATAVFSLMFLFQSSFAIAQKKKSETPKLPREESPLIFKFGPEFEFRNFKLAICSEPLSRSNSIIFGMVSLVVLTGTAVNNLIHQRYSDDQKVSSMLEYLVVPLSLAAYSYICMNLKMEKEETKRAVEFIKTLVGDDYLVDTTNGVDAVFTDRKSQFWFRISTDPTVIEVQMQPLTVPQLKAFEKQIQTYIFDGLKKMGITPTKFFNMPNGGHVNMDMNPFENNVELFGKFIKDYMNHSELSTGIFLNDRYNAPAVATLPQIKENLEVFFDENNKTARKKQNLKSLDTYVNIFYRDAFIGLDEGQKEKRKKNLEINLHYKGTLPEDRRIEFRGYRAYNIEDFQKIANLLSKRVAWLQKQEDVKFEARLFNNPIDKIARFRSYVEESGLAWKDYVPLLPRNLRFYLNKETFEIDSRWAQKPSCTMNVIHPLVKALYWFRPQL